MKIKTDFLVKKLQRIEERKKGREPLVGDLMSTGVITIGPEETVVDAAEKMLENRIHALIVTDGDKPLGIIASYDLLLVMSISDYFDKNTQVKDVMIKDLLTASPGDDLTAALKTMIEYNIRLLAVVEEEKLVGVLSLIDLVLGFVDLSKVSLEVEEKPIS